MRAVILLAGEGTRMGPMTYTIPKPLLKIAGKTLLQHNLEQLKQNGISDIVLLVGYLRENIKEFLETISGFNFQFVVQNEQLGTGHALLQTKDLIKEEKFLVLYGDDLYDNNDIKKVLNNDLCVTAKEVGDPERFGVFLVENGIVKDLVEKPKNYISNLANTGLYVLNKDIFSSLQNLKKTKRNELELTDSILELANEHSIKCEITNNWVPIGYPWDLLTANEMKIKETENLIDSGSFVDKNVTIEGSVKIGKNTRIKNGTYIEGPVIISENCVIGPNCYIRPNSVIGNGCRIGNAVEIKNTLIGDTTNIEHLSYVGDSIIGNNCNLGAGTIAANLRHDNRTIRANVKDEVIDTRRKKFGVVMGDYTKIGVNCSIYPGMMLGPFSWTSPGSIIKTNIAPLTLNGNKILDETKFDSNVSEKVRHVRRLVNI